MNTQPHYATRLKDHLASYKESELQIPGSGIFKYKGRLLQYPYILPKDCESRNLLPVYLDACWAYTEDIANHVKRHLYFHHLNSSQAMCLNLFFPFVVNNHSLLPVLQAALKLPEGAAEPGFEKVLVEGENTNFDFLLEYKEGPKVFFELKLSESEFGKANPKKHPGKYQGKLETYYRKPLSKLLDSKWVQFDKLVKHYQILRNISYLSPDSADRLIFIFPKANEALRKGEEIIREMIKPNLLDKVKIVYLEDLVQDLLKSPQLAGEQYQKHFGEFQRKYIL